MASIRNFVSHVAQPALLQTFLESHGINLSWETLNGSATAVSQAIETELKTLAPGAHSRLKRKIEIVEKMATEAGDVAIRSVTLEEEIAEMPSRQARALWLLMNDADRFRRAADIVFVDTHRYGRQWNSFLGPKGAEMKVDAASLDAFKAALRQAFDTPNVHIDIYDRCRPEFIHNGRADVNEEDTGSAEASLVQVTIYCEGPPNTENAFVEGNLTTQIRRPVLEAAITFEPETGTIECVAAQRERRDEVVKNFGIIVLGCSPDFEPCKARNYNLAVLQERVDFATDPTDGIEEVSVALLRLNPTESFSPRVTVEKLSHSDDIWSVADERLGEGALKTDFVISQARIEITYRSAESTRLRTLPITITHPHRSSIKEQSDIERVIANKYLPKWGLVLKS